MRNAASAAVDAAANIVAERRAASPGLLSLPRFSGAHADRICMRFEPYGSRFDVRPCALLRPTLTAFKRGDGGDYAGTAD
jgi:hypothetical protein